MGLGMLFLFSETRMPATLKGKTARGGKRPGAGRPNGRKSAKTILVGNVLANNTEKILNKAISMAMRSKPNVPVLLKLLDKVSPSLSSSKFNGQVSMPFDNISDERLRQLAIRYAKLRAEREQEEKSE
jgi:hypothetical protein